MSPTPDAAAIARMNRAMAHRGPDDEGMHIDPDRGVGLGARRLSVIDVEGGHQPLANEDGTVWAVLNGEIYNFESLRARLLDAGHTFSTHADTEVLVHLYEEYGEELVHAIEGMYAFALWDARRAVLLLARDRFGEKPLFYLERGGRLVFASELTALVTGAGTDWAVDPAVVDAYFVFGYVPDARSFVRGIRQLPPGHLLRWDVSAGRSALRPYWAPPAFAHTDATPLGELIAETVRLLENAVRSRLVADVPVGVFLSGGVDSTLIAALAARHSSAPLKTFTVGYEDGSVNETAAARRVASLVGAEHHELVVTREDVAVRVPGFLRELDQPVADSAFVALTALAEFARSDVTVAVGGEGADEIFGGYPRYRWLATAARVPDWAQHDRAARLAARLGRIPRLGRASRLRELLTAMSTVERHMNWVTDRRPACREQFYGPRLRPLVRRQPFATRVEEIVDLSLNGDIPGQFMRLDQLHWLPGDVLTKADRATMRASLEFRTPFLNRELAEFAATVPASVHVRAGGKLLVRRALQELLPNAGHRRPKTAFRTPSADWLRRPLARAFAEQLRSNAVYSEGWFDRDAVARAFGEHKTGRADWSHVLWPVFVLGCWFDGAVEADVR